MKEFVIYCFARTGSYRLVDILNNQDGVICLGEIFKNNRLELPEKVKSQVKNNGWAVAKREEKPIRYYSDVKEAARENFDNDVFGFKIFPNHNSKAYAHFLNQQDVRKVFLSRNPVQSFVSQEMAKKTGLWVRKDERKGVDDKKIAIDFDLLLNHVVNRMNVYLKMKHKLALRGEKLFEIDYCETFDDESLRKLADFIGIPAYSPVETGHKKIINKDYTDVVTNWEEVECLMCKMGVSEKMNFFEFVRVFSKYL